MCVKISSICLLEMSILLSLWNLKILSVNSRFGINSWNYYFFSVTMLFLNKYIKKTCKKINIIYLGDGERKRPYSCNNLNS